MPYEIHDDKIVMRAGKYNLPKCCCGEPFQLNTVHREKTPCFSYIEHEWVGLTDDNEDSMAEVIKQANKEQNPESFARGVLWAEAKLKEKNHA